jgi:hypothetical protein
MKKSSIFRTASICLVILIISACAERNQEANFPVLSGPYLGQKPPGKKAEIFAPGIISTSDDELCSGFMNGGKIFIFSRLVPDSEWRYKPTYIMELKEDKWTEPQIVSFNSLYPYNFTVAADDRTLFFTSVHQSEDSSELRDPNIWAVQRSDGSFLEPRVLGFPINTQWSDNYPSVSYNGAIFFMSNREGSYGSVDIYRAESCNGRYTEAENLGIIVNTENPEQDPAIAPDESYLIYCSETLGGYGGYDLFIVFRKKNGGWTSPVNMGENINSPGEDGRPSITPDGKYVFFASNRHENKKDRDIFWVDAKIIDQLKPEELK